MIISEGTSTIVFADGGLPELMRWLEATPARRYATDMGGDDERASAFNGDVTWRETIRMCKVGWSEGASRIAHGMPVPAFGKENRRPHWAMDVMGELPDVPRYLAGDPRHMRRRKVDKGRKPVVVLYAGMGVQASVSTKEFTNYGIALCEMIDTMENNGTRVELNQLTRATRSSGEMITGWRVKEADQPLDLAAIAFTYMHPAAHRRLQFQMRARYWSTAGASTTLRAEHFPDAPANALVFAGISDNPGACKTLAGARAFLRERINKAAGTEVITTEMIEHLD